jgi:hypothetical protein
MRDSPRLYQQFSITTPEKSELKLKDLLAVLKLSEKLG